MFSLLPYLHIYIFIWDSVLISNGSVLLVEIIHTIHKINNENFKRIFNRALLFCTQLRWQSKVTRIYFQDSPTDVLKQRFRGWLSAYEITLQCTVSLHAWWIETNRRGGTGNNTTRDRLVARYREPGWKFERGPCINISVIARTSTEVMPFTQPSNNTESDRSSPSWLIDHDTDFNEPSSD